MKKWYYGDCARILLITVLGIHRCTGIKWDKIRCSFDREPVVEGMLPEAQLGRFPWMGVIQYDFWFAGGLRYAITGAVRIHPWYALAPAEDVAKIDRKTVTNSTHFIVWHSADVKYYMGVLDYILHNEYTMQITQATIAMIVLIPDKSNRLGHAATGKLRKEVTKVYHVHREDCNDFYKNAELDYKMMAPTHMMCAVATAPQPCVWDGGALLVARDSEIYWTLLGFGSRGPGCGAPARFVDVNSQMEWIDAEVAAASYYQCEDCLQQCCNAVYAKPQNKTLPFI